MGDYSLKYPHNATHTYTHYWFLNKWNIFSTIYVGIWHVIEVQSQGEKTNACAVSRLWPWNSSHALWISPTVLKNLISFPPCFSRCGMTEHTADCCHQTVLYNGVLHFYNHPHSHSTKLELIFSQICISPFFSWQNDTNVAMLSNRKTSNLCYFAFVIICWKLWYLVLAETHVCRRKNRH